jgi:hypothetical protein
MSRVKDGSLSVDYNYVRLAYLANTGNIQRAYAFVPKKTSSSAPGVVDVGQQPLMSSSDTVYRINFVDPDNDEGKLSALPQTSALYWYEGPTPPMANQTSTLNTAYSLVTGLGNYTPPKYLNLGANGSPAPWTPKFTQSGGSPNFGGDFDRGSFYVLSSPVNGMATYNYFLQWTESESVSGTFNGWVHYNVVTAQEPVFTPFTEVSTLSLSTDPGAAKLTAGNDTQIYVMAADTGGVLKRNIYSDSSQTWSGWNTIGNFATTNRSAAAASWKPGRLDVFCTGIGDTQMFHYAEQDGMQQLPGWGWESIGAPVGGFIEGPSVASAKDGHLFIVGTGGFGGVYYKTWHGCCEGGWSAWQGLAGGVIEGPPAAVSLSSNRVDVFARAGNRLWQYTAFDNQTANWEGTGSWTDLSSLPNGLPGTITASPAVAGRDSARVDVFAGDGLHPYTAGGGDSSAHSQVMHAWYNAGWSNWHTVGGLLPSGGETFPYRTMAAVASSPSRVRLFVRGLNGHLWWSANE